jgi:hypothetical protein
MAKPLAAPPPRSRGLLWTVGGVALALAVAFGIGRWTAPEPSPERALPEQAAPQAREYAQHYAPRPPVGDPVRPVVMAEASVPAPAPEARPAVTPELAARVTQDAKVQLESVRELIVSRCWPRNGVDGRNSARVTFNVTFDAQGRQIARGITEDRRAPAGAFGKCLRELPGTALAIAPPGTNIGVSLSVAYP